MHASVRRERMERNEAAEVVGRRGGRGRSRTRCADGEEPSQVKDHEPQYEPHMEMEEQVKDDVEQVDLKPESEQPNDNPSGPPDLSVLTMYHVHLARRMSDGVIRLYSFYLM
ncbi:hypothetical protein MtrunA17_Chr3g0106361 [Medicago truncatula]|uniref:Uncharacterized protein n=1 Tax=Medicago truncatula TaxID=3880 RepID=A0A396ITS0_MEDTR|nr:hypothetical protein MtrunA17_Chr3g0106361 [Medicago truncatula]